ncbi:MAG: GTP cyclohydrolase, FolE2/MptA family [Candidatus Altiarchaeota archaeon]
MSLNAETQEKHPDVREDLQSVGVTNLRTIVETKWKGKIYRFTPTIEITVDLPREKKGVHMSRLVESITEILEEETLGAHTSFEEIQRSILDRLAKKHPYKKGRIIFQTELVVAAKTPVTGKTTMEAHEVEVEVSRTESSWQKRLKVKVLGNTVCPHALKNNKGKTHIQRAVGTLEIETVFDNPIELEDMIKTVECSFPSPVYTLLKSDDENFVVETMYDNPMFVEDVTRNMISAAKKKYGNSDIFVSVVSEESIHRHDVKAEAYAKT